MYTVASKSFGMEMNSNILAGRLEPAHAWPLHTHECSFAVRLIWCDNFPRKVQCVEGFEV